ncbi:MAG: Mpo1-like protein [Pirellulales bacterium]
MARKQAEQWLAEYGESHRDSTNKRIHWVCVPLIVVSLLGLLWDVPTPAWMVRVPLLNWATAFVALCMVFYFSISIPLAIGMLIYTTIVIGLIVWYERLGIGPVWHAALAIFVVAWIGQFIGHKIEGKKPSFLKDILFLLVGPLWLLKDVYRKLGIRY